MAQRCKRARKAMQHLAAMAAYCHIWRWRARRGAEEGHHRAREQAARACQRRYAMACQLLFGGVIADLELVPFHVKELPVEEGQDIEGIA